MKKILYLVLSLALILCLFSGCGSEEKTEADDEKIKVVATVFPAYDWAREIIGNCDDVELILLLDNGVDMHSYQPSADDIITISTCDMFIYVGGQSDSWVDDALGQSQNKDMAVINMMDVMGESVREEAHLPGIEQEEEEHDHEYDEHIWLSLKNAQVICDAISDGLAQISPENQKIFSENCAAYDEKLSDLDSRYQAAADSSSIKTLVFADRFPFLYLTEDYGLDYYAAFEGCSAETEASFETVAYLASVVDDLNIKSILIIDGSDGKLAETIISNTAEKNQQILTLDSMQSVSSSDIEGGETYLDVMEGNLEVLEEALK